MARSWDIQVAQCNLKGPCKRKVGGSDIYRENVRTEAEVLEEKKCYTTAFKNDEKDHELQNVYSL